MGREHFIGRRAYHEDSGHEGIILDVHLNVRPQTARFQHDGTDATDANWVSLEKLKLLPSGASEDDDDDANSPAEVTKARADELLAYLPLFGSPDADPRVKWKTPASSTDNVLVMPYPTYSPEVSEFFRLASQDCWCDYHYRPDQALRMIQDDATIAAAPLADIKTMLTFCVRGERFSDGHWAKMISTGRIGAILQRLRKLRDALP